MVGNRIDHAKRKSKLKAKNRPGGLHHRFDLDDIQGLCKQTHGKDLRHQLQAIANGTAGEISRPLPILRQSQTWSTKVRNVKVSLSPVWASS
jgi:hypothetical protein